MVSYGLDWISINLIGLPMMTCPQQKQERTDQGYEQDDLARQPVEAEIIQQPTDQPEFQNGEEPQKYRTRGCLCPVAFLRSIFPRGHSRPKRLGKLPRGKSPALLSLSIGAFPWNLA